MQHYCTHGLQRAGAGRGVKQKRKDETGEKMPAHV